MRNNEGLDFFAKRSVSAGFLQEGCPVSGIQFQRGCQNGFDALPVFWCHACASLRLISRNSQARAVAHSRFTVVRQTPITLAVSSIDKPAKKAHFDDAALLRIQAREFIEGVIQGNQVNIRRFLQGHGLGEFQLEPATAFCGPVPAGVIDEDLAH
jgi:hypothetical protein